MKNNRAFELLKKASADLNLMPEPQDWGIINASHSRIKEFIEYFDKTLESTLRFELTELVIASLNEAILRNGAEKSVIYLVKEFVSKNSKNETHRRIFDYWIRIGNASEFPVGLWLKKILN